MRAAVAVSSQANRFQLVSHRQPCIFAKSKIHAVIARARPPQDHETGSDVALKRFEEAQRFVSTTWSKLDTQQRVYTVVVGVAALAALPQALMFVVIALERLLVGLLMAAEALLLTGTRLVVLSGLLALIVTGAYLFLFKKRSSNVDL